MLGTLADLLGNANGQTPLIVVVAGVILLAAGWIARKAFASQQRQGRRIGAVEKLLRSERTRRRQLEQTLREHGIRLSYWPDDPAELYAPYSGPGPWPDDGVPLPYEDQGAGLATTHLQTQFFVPPRPTTRSTS
jgi:hypothetical protein